MMKRITFKRMAVATAVSGALVASVPALADTYTATATVNNAITLTEVTPLNFGTFAVVNTLAGNDATLTVAPAGTISTTAGAAPTTDKFTTLGGHSAATISATVAPFTAVNFTIPTAAVTTLVHSSGNPSLPTFEVAAGGFSSSPAAVAGVAAVTADASGTANLNLGAVLSITAGAATNGFQDGTYSGTYDVTVSY